MRRREGVRRKERTNIQMGNTNETVKEEGRWSLLFRTNDTHINIICIDIVRLQVVI